MARLTDEFVCPQCGRGARADEDGACAGCGATLCSKETVTALVRAGVGQAIEALERQVAHFLEELPSERHGKVPRNAALASSLADTARWLREELKAGRLG